MTRFILHLAAVERLHNNPRFSERSRHFGSNASVGITDEGYPILQTQLVKYFGSRCVCRVGCCFYAEGSKRGQESIFGSVRVVCSLP